MKRAEYLVEGTKWITFLKTILKNVFFLPVVIPATIRHPNAPASTRSNNQQYLNGV